MRLQGSENTFHVRTLLLRMSQKVWSGAVVKREKPNLSTVTQCFPAHFTSNGVRTTKVGVEPDCFSAVTAAAACEGGE